MLMEPQTFFYYFRVLINDQMLDVVRRGDCLVLLIMYGLVIINEQPSWVAIACMRPIRRVRAKCMHACGMALILLLLEMSPIYEDICAVAESGDAEGDAQGVPAGSCRAAAGGHRGCEGGNAGVRLRGKRHCRCRLRPLPGQPHRPCWCVPLYHYLD